ncbi:MAG: hypothetical protein HOV80_08295 [Polyangiaceae bacterium]|nr:hypothetical protein [Polyangiaceae bacterium]
MPEPKDSEQRRSIPDQGGRGIISSAVAVGLGLCLVVGGALVYRSSSKPDDTMPTASASANVAEAGRCREVAPGKSYVVGPSDASKASSSASPDEDPPDRDDLLSPFAIVLGRAIAWDGGYAVGAQGEGEGGTLSSLVLVGPDGATGTPIRLSRSRGDLDPPVVAAAGSGFVVALIEPNAGGRAVRVARVDGEKVVWGAELRESNDESLALDIGVSGDRGLVAWDAIEDERSYVAVSGFTAANVGDATGARRLTPKTTDAEAPRIVSRPGGFYVVYLVRGQESAREAARPSEAAPGVDKPKKKKEPKGDKRAPGEVDETRGGEAVTSAWLEVVLVDASGAPSGDPLRVTPDDGHVISFDAAPAADGGLVLAYRDEDSPTGAGGGMVKMIRIAAGGGISGSHQSDEGTPSDGAPTLLPGWVAIPTLRGADLLARLGNDGLPSEPILADPSLGRGEPIAARGDQLLVAEPEGKAMRLRVLTCGERPAPPAAAPESGE